MVIIAAFVVWGAVAGARRVLSSIVSAPPSDRSALSLVPADGVIEPDCGRGVAHGQKDGQIRLNLSVYLAVKFPMDKKTDKSVLICPCVWQ